MTGLPTLTLKQPYASLIMAGIKTIETRSWAAPKGLVGRRIGIHAGKAWDPVWGGWLDTVIDDDMLWHLEDLGVLLTDSADDTVSYRAWRPSLPAGALLGTAVLAACVPMVRLHSPDPDGPSLGISSADGSLWLLDAGGVDGKAVDDQAPFGFFELGNWAWLLEDVKPTTEQCPWCQGEGGFKEDSMILYGVPGGWDWSARCDVCEGTGKCGPIPANGQQKIWRWTP